MVLVPFAAYTENSWLSIFTFDTRQNRMIAKTYLNYNEISHNGKQSNIRESKKLEENLEHILNFAGFSILIGSAEAVLEA